MAAGAYGAAVHGDQTDVDIDISCRRLVPCSMQLTCAMRTPAAAASSGAVSACSDKNVGAGRCSVSRCLSF